MHRDGGTGAVNIDRAEEGLDGLYALGGVETQHTHRLQELPRREHTVAVCVHLCKERRDLAKVGFDGGRQLVSEVAWD